MTQPCGCGALAAYGETDIARPGGPLRWGLLAVVFGVSVWYFTRSDYR